MSGNKREAFCYNINGVRVRMFIDKPYRQLSSFMCAKMVEADLEFHIDVLPSFSCDNSIRSSYRHKLSHWEILLEGFDDAHTVVYFKGDRFFSRHLFFTMIFEPLLQFKQTKCSHLVLHASAVSHGGKAYVFSGDATIGKTSLLLNFLSKGFGYLADDQTMIDMEHVEVLPYALPVGVNFKLAIKTHLSLRFGHYVKLFYQTVVNALFVNYSHLTTNVQLSELRFGDKTAIISESTELSKIFVLSNGPLMIKRLDALDAYRLLWGSKVGSRSKLPALIYYGAEYQKVDADFQLWGCFKYLLARLVLCVPVYSVSFYHDQFDEAIKLIEKKMQDNGE